MIGPVALGLGVSALGRGWLRSPWVVGLGAAAVAVAPLQALAGGFLVWAVDRFRRAARRSAEERRTADAALEAAELVALGLAGGLSVASAHRLAAHHADRAVQPELERLVASMGESGAAAALAADSGPTAGSSAALATAAAAGSPALPALEAHVEHEHHRRHTAAVETARRLPVRLLLPLTLLVLPGFVLITVGPTVADSLARLAP